MDASSVFPNIKILDMKGMWKDDNVWTTPLIIGGLRFLKNNRVGNQDFPVKMGG